VSYFKDKLHQIQFLLGLRPNRPIAGFKGPSSKGKEGRGGKGDGRGRKWPKRRLKKGAKGGEVEGEGVDIAWPDL